MLLTFAPMMLAVMCSDVVSSTGNVMFLIVDRIVLP